MTFKKIIGLGCIVGIMSLFIFQYEVPKDRMTQKEKLLLKGLNEDALTSVVITRENETFTLKQSKEKEEESPKWRLADLPQSELDRGAVASLVNSLLELKLGDPIPDEDVEGELDVYGLKNPSLKLEVSFDGGKEALELGIKSEYLGERYLRAPSSGKVYLIPDTLHFASNKSPDDFRDRTPIDIETTDISSIVIEHSSSRTELKKSKSGWVLASQDDLVASDSAVNELLRKVRALEVSEFHDETPVDLVDYGLEEPDVTLSFIHGGELKQVVSLSSPTPKDGENVKTYFTFSPFATVFDLDGTQIGDFILTSKQLMDRKVFAFNVYSASKAIIQLNGDSVSFSKNEQSEWLVNGKEADNLIVESFLREVSQIEVETEFSSEIDEFQPIWSMEVSVEGEDPIKLQVGPSKSMEGGSFHHVKREGRDAFYRVSETVFSKLIPKIEAFLKTDENEEVEEVTQEQSQDPGVGT